MVDTGLADGCVVVVVHRRSGGGGMVTGGDGMRLIHRVELEDWFGRVGLAANPVTAAGRQFDALISEDEGVPGLDAYDHLFDVANLAVHWTEENPCPDNAVEGRRFRTR